jgi:vacuolar protein-sorting-associated protein 4
VGARSRGAKAVSEKNAHPAARLRGQKAALKDPPGHLGEQCSEEDFDGLARRSEGFSASDVATAIQDGLMVPIKKVHMATQFRRVQHNGSEYFTPCDKSDPAGIPMTWKKVPANKLREPPLTPEDLFVVMESVKPSVAHEELARYQEWTHQFGLEGAESICVVSSQCFQLDLHTKSLRDKNSEAVGKTNADYD